MGIFNNMRDRRDDRRERRIAELEDRLDDQVLAGNISIEDAALVEGYMQTGAGFRVIDRMLSRAEAGDDEIDWESLISAIVTIIKLIMGFFV